MQDYETMEPDARAALLAELRVEYEAAKAKNLKLDMSRGKPGAEQLALSAGLHDPALLSPPQSENGLDCRNYGVLEGIPEARRLFAELLDLPPEQLIVCGNSSLSLMYDYLAQCMLFGAGGAPWCAQGKVKFLCPVPGYDRHFTILEQLGIEMINIPLRAGVPDIALVEQYARDESVKGLICVPKYSNPAGSTFSDETVRRLAALRPAANDFRIIWDNAYLVHDLYDETEPLLNILAAAGEYGTQDQCIVVTSFSKISFPGAAVSALAASPANIAAVLRRMNAQTIGYDKLNQLRHARFFRDAAGVRAHMHLHAQILRPKFEAVLAIFERDLRGSGVASWTAPRGGYFISLDLPHGCAKRTHALCKAAGVTLTGAGATFPYGRDPEDKNLRIAPTYPPLAELRQAAALLTLCARIAALEGLT
ncbi:MAG: aminotransferase class I/II-fold pyridoxal phosphate-dependent enzyme [Oscillospiraceae bacterium]|jgi:DNA-binding transcriptional MocR family regulator|nr:aminotransferase class I/II-fold pyridoxal phosphate-dependent enzyme [Oscillospiraceae bacterium]